MEQRPGVVSGVPVFRGTRVPVHALYENLLGGATIDDFVEWFDGVTREQVEQLLEYQISELKGSRLKRLV